MFWPFGRKGSAGSKSKKSSDLTLLNKADEALVRAYQTHTPGTLSEFLTRKCLTAIMEKIRCSQKTLVAVERYKKVNWERVSDNTYVKKVSFEDIEIGTGFYIPMGDQYNETWTLCRAEDKHLVDDIRRTQC